MLQFYMYLHKMMNMIHYLVKKKLTYKLQLIYIKEEITQFIISLGN